jgi:hypothetical protein
MKTFEAYYKPERNRIYIIVVGKSQSISHKEFAIISFIVTIKYWV